MMDEHPDFADGHGDDTQPSDRRRRSVDASAVGTLVLGVPWFIYSLAVVYLLAALFLSGIEAAIVVLLWVLSGAFSFVRSLDEVIARFVARARPPTERELATLNPLWETVTAAADVDGDEYSLWVEDVDDVNAAAAGGHVVAVSRAAVEIMPAHQLAAVLAHELGHHVGGHSQSMFLAYWYSIPARLFNTVVQWLVGVVIGRVRTMMELSLVVALVVLGLGSVLVLVVIALVPSPIGVALLAIVSAFVFLPAWYSRLGEFRADRFAAEIGFDEPLIEGLEDWIWTETWAPGPAAFLDRALASHPPLYERINRLNAFLHSDEATRRSRVSGEQRPRPLGDSWRSSHPAAAQTLDQLSSARRLNDVDEARIAHALESAGSDHERLDQLAAELVTSGERAMLHWSGQRDLPTPRIAAHNLTRGQVRIGRIVPMAAAPNVVGDELGIDHDILRTSLLAVGPPGSGKTRGFAYPIVEHLSLSALVGRASVVVIDPKGDDFDFPGWFDVTIDPLSPTIGFDLFGGADEPDSAADRLASALLPPQVSDDLAYFMNASRNALHACLAPYHRAFGTWPTVRELLALLRLDQATVDRVKGALKGPRSKEYKQLLDSRAAQRRSRHDPSASMVERLALLDRPRLSALLDSATPKFRMRDVNEPIRVRVALPEAEYPDASRILARLVVSQFVQVCSSARSLNRDLFKALVIDESGRFVDEYVARGVQRLRSSNAGLVLLAQTLSDFPPDIRSTIFGSAGSKAVFGGVDPADAEVFSQWFGDQWVPQVTLNRSEQESTSTTQGRSESESEGTTRGTSVRKVERARWTVSDIVTAIPTGHCVVAFSRSTGERTGPRLVNLRA